ncbi:hypothetical protein D5F01_LYC16504 [Larimichthys crocea]|uniref:G-protein coupled receptors family 1 profile domain-containing protein n=1 Tax=Larimichthys crocea TaxID=215358 RepID=A0A6G0I138_LARCR|nr:hypothetical protein D5F01_LYC16504 [Larimichthys crocea]
MDAEELIESIIRGLMFLAGILGNNWLAVRSLPGQISGIRTNEVLFINLAVSNLITNYLVDLPDTIADFAGRWFLGETFCGVFRFCADLSETSSIYTTFFISAFWHQKLVGSLKRGGPSKDLQDSASTSHVYTGVPASSYPNGGMSGDSSKSSPLTTETNTVSSAGAPPNVSRPSQMPAKPSPSSSSSSQVRAAKSVVAVASVFLVCWLTHLLLRITNNIHTSSIVVEVASYIAASYTCIIPYIFLYGVKKLSCFMQKGLWQKR